MFNTVEEYLDALKQEMKGMDRAVLQDALADAEEHLRSALETAGDDSGAALRAVIEEYGTPAETAAAYAEAERRLSPAPDGLTSPRKKSVWRVFFGIYTDLKAWGALFYMFIAVVTGTLYFSWAVIGSAVSVKLFIFGLPVAVLLLFSVRGMARFEGRLVEALLGVRMPRRPLSAPRNKKFFQRILQMIKEKHTWLSLLYMFTQFFLGVLYFVVSVLLITFSLSGVLIPVRQEIFHTATIQIGTVSYYFPRWSYPLILAGGTLLLTVTLHLAKGIGRLHGRYAKMMLVARRD